MATHVLILGAFVHEEMMVCMHTSNCDMETLKLNERKKEISIHIQDNIIELLEKKRRYKTIKLETKEAKRGVLELMEKIEIVEEFKEIIKNSWIDVVEAANYV
ncbi:hypothetical protein QL285_003955 [Trifolium repens]|nr:hypothetical protein QL285_003955 [Trifolium repens]